MRSGVFATLTLILSLATVSNAAPEANFAGWPEDWISAYQRFEKFVATQNENVPETDVTISPTGVITSDLPDSVDRETFTTAVFFQEGVDILEMGLKGQFLNGRREGTYAICLRTTGKLVGYQYVHPLRWFQVEPAKAVGDRSRRGTVRMIEQPQPEMDNWPNDRLLRYHDFQVLPHNNPLEFIRVNKKVSPKITLAVTNAGIIQRQKLDDAHEKLLRWRIYFNGHVVEKDAATGDLQHAVAQGMGSYVAFVGVEGPNGFMPVSNFLQFPLFPELDGHMAVVPAVTNADGLPDSVRAALSPDQLDELRTIAGQFKEADAHDRAMSYALDSIRLATDRKKQALISLWQEWAWNVGMVKSAITRINMAEETK